MDKNLKAAITLPEGYAESNTSYPVVYLLHGGFGAFSDWHQKVTEPGLVPKLADRYQLIIVTPGVGPSSYYYDSPLMDSVQYESYITRELIPFIDQTYRTLDQKRIPGHHRTFHGRPWRDDACGEAPRPFHSCGDNERCDEYRYPALESTRGLQKYSISTAESHARK